MPVPERPFTLYASARAMAHESLFYLQIRCNIGLSEKFHSMAAVAALSIGLLFHDIQFYPGSQFTIDIVFELFFLRSLCFLIFFPFLISPINIDVR